MNFLSRHQLGNSEMLSLPGGEEELSWDPKLSPVHLYVLMSHVSTVEDTVIFLNKDQDNERLYLMNC